MNKISKLIFSVILLTSPLSYAETVEVVIFDNKENVNREHLLKSADAMLSTLQNWPGYISRELVEVSADKWIDIVHRKNETAAIQAQEKAMKSEVYLTSFN